MEQNLSLQISDYMQTLEPGSVLWEIGSVTLNELDRAHPFRESPKRHVTERRGKSRLCYDPVTGEVFISISEMIRQRNMSNGVWYRGKDRGRFEYI